MKYDARFRRVVDRLRARGFDVVEVAGCYGRGVGGGDFAVVPEHVTVHHTATGGTADYASLSLVTNGRKNPDGSWNLRGPLANFGVGRRGTIFLIATGYANHAGATWHAYQTNTHSIGIEAENNGIGEVWGSPIYTALVALAQELRVEFGISRARVEGHKETCSPRGRKIDPANFDMARFRVDTDYTPEDDLSAAAEKAIAEIHAALIGSDSVGSKVDGRRMPLREMLEWIDLGVNNSQSDAFLDALADRVIARLLNTRVDAATWRDGTIRTESTALREAWARAAEASPALKILNGPTTQKSPTPTE